jgi:hypothetical protein
MLFSLVHKENFDYFEPGAFQGTIGSEARK